MEKDPRKTLSTNVSRIIRESGESVSAWARAHSLDKKRVQRALTGDHATTLDVIDSIARAVGLEPWQLLMPGLNPKQPPVFTLTKQERDLYARMRDDIMKLPDPYPPPPPNTPRPMSPYAEERRGFFERPVEPGLSSQ